MSAVAVDLDGALGNTRPLWDAFLADASRRFATIAVLDPAELPQDRAAAAELLDRWAEAGVGDWRRALERFAEDHAAIYLRPNPGVNAALRAVAGAGRQIGVFTDAPEPLARVALAHLGLARDVTALETGAGAEERLRTRLGGDVDVVRAAEVLTTRP